MKAIGYIRVSTEQQAGEGVSLEAQKAKIEAWCIANDRELVAVYVDAGISGKSMEKRTGLQKALAETGKGMVLAVHSLSRLARSTKDLLTISEMLQAKKIELVSVTEKVDTSSAYGEFFFTLMGAISQLERRMIGDRTKMALAHKKASGQKYAPVPFGYQEIEGRLEAVEAEAQLVVEIQNKRQAGYTLQSIADNLNERGIKGKQGGRWHPSNVRYVLQRVAA